MKKTILGIALFAVTSSAYAGSLLAPFAQSSARVMPQGVRNLNYKGLFIAQEGKFDSAGNKTILADPFFTDIQLGTMISGSYYGSDAGKLKSVMDKMGATESDIFGQTIGQVNVSALANVPILAWGITEKFTAAIAVPVTFTSINVDTGVVHNNQALYDAFLAAVASSPSAQVEFKSKMANAINRKLEDDGYEELKNLNETNVGDVKVVGKYRAYEDMKNTLVVGADLTLPTGREANPDRVIDAPAGDGQFDVGFNIAHGYRLSSQFTFTTSIAYAIQLADQAQKRIPYRDDSTISPDKEEVDRDLGDIFNASATLQFSRKGLTVGAGYSFQEKGKDIYSGTVYDPQRYTWMSQDTYQSMNAALVTVGYDTISLFRQKKFPVPLSIGVTHTQVLSGKNVSNDPMTTLDLSLFF